MNSVSPNKSVYISAKRGLLKVPHSQFNCPFLQTVESFWELVSKDIFPKVKDFALKTHFLCFQASKIYNRTAVKRLDGSLRLLPLTLILIQEWYVIEASTTSIPLIEVCRKLLLCNNFNDEHTYLPFSVLNLVNMLFYTSFYWKWPSSCCKMARRLKDVVPRLS